MPRPPGRPPATRNIFDLATTHLPGLIAVDTSAVVAALIDSEPQHTIYADAFARLVGDGAVLGYSELLEVELAEASFAIALKRRHGGRWHARRRDGRVRSAGARLHDDVQERWTAIITNVDHRPVPISSVTTDTPWLMRAFGLNSYDAVHAATAIYLNSAILARDVHFGSLPAALLSIYTDSTRLAASRAGRP